MYASHFRTHINQSQAFCFRTAYYIKMLHKSVRAVPDRTFRRQLISILRLLTEPAIQPASVPMLVMPRNPTRY